MAPARSYLRALQSKIHPQLPLDPRQSRQLLSILKTSFQKQLDLVHPPVETLHGPAVPASEFKAIVAQRKIRDLSLPVTPQASTAKHFESVLSNPLLVNQPNPNLFIFGCNTLPNASKQHTPLVTSFSSPHEAQRWFAEHVIREEASLDTAKTYLRSVQNFWASQPSTSRQYAECSNSQVKAGADIIQWILSIPIKAANRNLTDVEFSSMLTRSVVEEQNYKGISTLLAHTSSLALFDSTANHASQRVLIHAFVKSWLKTTTPIENIVQEFLEIAAAYQKFLPALKSDKIHYMKRIFGPTARRIAESLAASGAKVAVTTYDQFLNSFGQWSREQSMAGSMLHLYHPTKPDATAFLQRLKSASMSQSLLETSSKKRRAVVQMCLDTVQLLFSQGDYTNASWVLDFASQNLAQELGFEHENIKTLANPSHAHGVDDLTKRDSKKRHTEELQDMSVFAVG